MACQFLGAGIIVCGPPPGVYRRRYMDCPTEKRRTRFIQRHDGIWYGSTLICVSCGDAWQDGWRMERPFRRGWREEAKARALSMWQSAMTPQRYREAIRAEEADYLDFAEEVTA